MKTKITLIIILIWSCCMAMAGIKPVRLTCENINNPMVVDILKPRLSWIMFSQAPEKDKPNRWINLGDWVSPFKSPPYGRKICCDPNRIG